MITPIKTLEPLFRPLPFGATSLRNRFVMPAMTRRFCVDGVPGSEVGDYYARRAYGGVGLIVTEGGYVEPKGLSGQPKVPAFYGHAALEAWKKIVDRVHGGGAAIIPQLWHSLLPDQADNHLNGADLHAVLEAYTTAARGVHAAGFDGIEIQCGGKYTADLFISAFDGELLLAKVVRALRAEVGPHFPIIVRASEWRRSDAKTPLARDMAELEGLFRPIAIAGASFVHIDTADFNGIPYELAPYKLAEAVHLSMLAGHATNLPAVAVGRIVVNDAQATLINLNALSGFVSNGDLALVAAARGLIADADLVNKIQNGDLASALHFHEGLRAQLY